jgi:hypothetical protein
MSYYINKIARTYDALKLISDIRIAFYGILVKVFFGRPQIFFSALLSAAIRKISRAGPETDTRAKGSGKIWPAFEI